MLESPSNTPHPDPARPARRARRLTADEARRRRDRWVAWGLWTTFSVLLINAVVGDKGYLTTIRAARTEAAIRAETRRLRVENQQLREARERLEQDPTALEEAARRLGMIRDGETVVTIRDRTSATPETSPR